MVMRSPSTAFSTPRRVSPLVSVMVIIGPPVSGTAGLAGGGAVGVGGGATCANAGAPASNVRATSDAAISGWCVLALRLKRAVEVGACMPAHSAMRAASLLWWLWFTDGWPSPGRCTQTSANFALPKENSFHRSPVLPCTLKMSQRSESMVDRPRSPASMSTHTPPFA